jgi:acyl-CoA synthetase (NDP forming)
MVVDQLGLRGLEVAVPSPETLAEIESAVGFEVPPARIVDLTLRGTGVAPMSAAMEILRNSGEIDLLIQTVGSSGASQPEIGAAPALAAEPGGVPLAIFVVPEAPDILRLLGERGIAAFRTPESCADAIAALLARRIPHARPQTPPPNAGEATTLDEVEGYELLEQAGISCTPTLVLGAGEEAPQTLPFPYPVVVKGVVPGVAHKTEAGAVQVDVLERAGVSAAIERMASRLPVRRFLVQPQLEPVAEVLVGFRRDPQVGPIMLVAAGGLLAELGSARSIRTAPVDIGTANEMLAEIPGLSAILGGYRGQAAGDAGALAQTIVSLSKLALRPDVLEAEINPVIVTTAGAYAADALVSVARP